jgi:hypothetical protein
VTLLGPNKMVNPGFDGTSGYVLNQNGTSIAEIVNGKLHCLRFSGQTANATQLGTVAVAGRQYQIRCSAEQISGGTLNFAFGGISTFFTKVGLNTAIITASTTTGFSMAPSTAFPSEILVDWVSIREVGKDMSKLVLTMRDFDGDKRQTSIEMGEVTDGTTYTTISGQASTLATAIQAVCAGKRAKQEFIATSTAPDDTNAANVLAQTSYRWIIEYNDATTGDGPYQIDLPTPDLADNSLVLAGSHHHDPANAEWVTLKAAMEGGEVKNPRTGNNISITAIFLEQ